MENENKGNNTEQRKARGTGRSPASTICVLARVAKEGNCLGQPFCPGGLAVSLFA